MKHFYTTDVIIQTDFNKNGYMLKAYQKSNDITIP